VVFKSWGNRYLSGSLDGRVNATCPANHRAYVGKVGEVAQSRVMQSGLVYAGKMWQLEIALLACTTMQPPGLANLNGDWRPMWNKL
jgi:hypothetical protein